MWPQKNSATIPNKVFACFLSDSNFFEADCVAEKDIQTYITKYNRVILSTIHLHANYELSICF